MGLDGYELVMEVEDEFGITISDAEMIELRTVGDLVDLCLNRITAAQQKDCVLLPSHRSLQTLVRDVLGDPEFKMHSKDKLEQHLNVKQLRALWARLPKLLKTSPQQLRRPLWMRRTLISLVLCLPIALLFALPRQLEFLVLAWFATVGFGICLHLATDGMRSVPPDGYATFGEITKRIVGAKVATTPPLNSDYESVFASVKQMVVSQLGVEEDEVHREARFVEDLGVG